VVKPVVSHADLLQSTPLKQTPLDTYTTEACLIKQDQDVKRPSVSAAYVPDACQPAAEQVDEKSVLGKRESKLRAQVTSLSLKKRDLCQEWTLGGLLTRNRT